MVCNAMIREEQNAHSSRGLSRTIRGPGNWKLSEESLKCPNDRGMPVGELAPATTDRLIAAAVRRFYRDE